MKLIKYFESKIPLFEFLNNIFYNQGRFYPINSIYINDQHVKLIDSPNGYKKFHNSETFVTVKKLKKPIKIFFYSNKIKESDKNIDGFDPNNSYIEFGNKYFPITGNSFFISKSEKKVDFSEDKKDITYNNKKYYLTSKEISSAYVIDRKDAGSNSGSTEDFSSEMQPEEPTPEPPTEETK